MVRKSVLSDQEVIKRGNSNTNYLWNACHTCITWDTGEYKLAPLKHPV